MVGRSRRLVFRQPACPVPLKRCKRGDRRDFRRLTRALEPTSLCKSPGLQLETTAVFEPDVDAQLRQAAAVCSHQERGGRGTVSAYASHPLLWSLDLNRDCHG